MLADSFYTILVKQAAPQALTALIAFNEEHPVFDGHFPGQPVVPGVCMMQLVQELLEDQLQQPLLLQKASSMKFLNMIDPTVQPQVTVELQYTQEAGLLVKASAVIKSETMVFMKFQGTFSPL